MHFVRKASLAIAALVVATGSSIAADVGPAATTPLPIVEAPSPAPFEWGGWYMGVYSATTIPLPSDFSGVLGGVLGYDVAIADRFVAGISIAAHMGVGSFNRTDGQLNLRAGFLIADRLLAYGRIAVGTGQHLVPFSHNYWYYSFGAEVALGTNWSLFSELGWLRGFGSTSSEFVLVAGFNWRLRR